MLVRPGVPPTPGAAVKYACSSSSWRGGGSCATVAAAASVSAPPIPRKDWKVFRGSTKTYTFPSEVGSDGLNISESAGANPEPVGSARGETRPPPRKDRGGAQGGRGGETTVRHGIREN